jgi:hypothetical protein
VWGLAALQASLQVERESTARSSAEAASLRRQLDAAVEELRVYRVEACSEQASVMVVIALTSAWTCFLRVGLRVEMKQTIWKAIF